MLIAIHQKIVTALIMITSLFNNIYAVNPDYSLLSANEYKAMTYNIHHGTTVVGNPSLESVLKTLKTENPDFIALQEVDKYNPRSGFKDQIKWLSEKLKMDYVFGSNINYGLTEYGNGILSKYPIVESGKVDLAFETEPRSMLWAKVKTDDGELYVTSIHLGLDKKMREEHFKIIEDFVNNLDDNTPILLMGDFNVLPDNQIFSHFRSRITGKINHDEIPTYFKHEPIQIDYIFGKNIKENTSYNIPSKASDHYPLILTFKIVRNPNQKYLIDVS